MITARSPWTYGLKKILPIGYSGKALSNGHSTTRFPTADCNARKASMALTAYLPLMEPAYFPTAIFNICNASNASISRSWFISAIASFSSGIRPFPTQHFNTDKASIALVLLSPLIIFNFTHFFKAKWS